MTVDIAAHTVLSVPFCFHDADFAMGKILDRICSQACPTENDRCCVHVVGLLSLGRYFRRRFLSRLRMSKVHI